MAYLTNIVFDILNKIVMNKVLIFCRYQNKRALNDTSSSKAAQFGNASVRQNHKRHIKERYPPPSPPKSIYSSYSTLSIHCKMWPSKLDLYLSRCFAYLLHTIQICWTISSCHLLACPPLYLFSFRGC